MFSLRERTIKLNNERSSRSDDHRTIIRLAMDTPTASSIPRSRPTIGAVGRSNGRSLVSPPRPFCSWWWSSSRQCRAACRHDSQFWDAATAIPLGIAFWFARKKPSQRFTFGYGRVEDLAGLAIVLTILASAIVAGYESIERLLHPQDISYLGAVIAASVIGFLGNEAVAIFRIRVGQEINSAALIADGYHARVDGWTSLAVLFGAVGVWLGYPLADPIIGLLITAAILGIVIQSGKSIVFRMLDGAEPKVIDELRHAAEDMPQVKGGHRGARALAQGTACMPS